MATTIGKLRVILTANAGRFNKAMGRARKSLRRFSSLALKLGGIGGGGGLAAITIGSFRAIDALDKTSKKLGIATEKLAGLQLAAKLTGVPIRTLEMGLQRMTRRFAEAAKGTGEAKEAIKTMGLDARKLAATSPDVIFGAMAVAMAKVGAESEKLRLAFKTLDSEGVALKITLGLGREGLARIQEMAEQLGIALKQDVVDGVVRANDAMTQLKTALQGFGNSIAVRVAPTVEKFANLLTGLAVQIAKGNKLAIVAAAKYAAWGAALVVAGAAITKIIRLSMVFVAAMRAIVTSQTLVMAFSGPKGWAALAAGLAVAGAAAWGVSKAFSAVRKDIADAQKEGAGFAKQLAAVAAAEAAAGGAGAGPGVRGKINKDLKQAQDIIRQLAIELRGQSAIDQLIDKLRGLKVPRGFIDIARQLGEDLASKKVLKNLQEQAKAIKAMVMTPIDRFKAKYAELTDLFRKGLIDSGTFANATALFKKQFGLTKKTKEVLGQAGTIQGRTRQRGFIRAGGIEGVQKIEDINKKQLTTLQQILNALRTSGFPIAMTT